MEDIRLAELKDEISTIKESECEAGFYGRISFAVVCYLVDEIEKLKKENEALTNYRENNSRLLSYYVDKLVIANKRNEILREAVEFYADEANWFLTEFSSAIDDDDIERSLDAIRIGGKRARKALKRVGEL